MQQSIDVTGLRPEAIRAVESLVGHLRQEEPNPLSLPASIFDLFGKAPTLRTAEDIAKQLEDERDAWGQS